MSAITRASNLTSRLLTRSLSCGSKSSLVALRPISTTPQVQRHLVRWPFSGPDHDIFSASNSLMRNLEREFDSVRRMIDKSFFPRTSFGEFPSLAASEASESSMIHTDEAGNRKLQLSFDLRGFKPEEIKVRTEGQILTVSAKKENKEKDNYYLREFSQSFSLPADLKVQDLKSKWADEGFLTIEGALPKLPEAESSKVKEIPIEHGSSMTKEDTAKLENSTDRKYAANPKKVELPK